MLADQTFGSRIHAKRIAAAGFSLGGYTVLAIAGGITDRSAYIEFCKSSRADNMCKAPPEFPVDLFAQSDQLAVTDPARAIPTYRSPAAPNTSPPTSPTPSSRCFRQTWAITFS